MATRKPGKFGRYWFKVASVLGAAAALVVAVVVDDASNWLRGLLVAIAIGLLMLARMWGQIAWPDVAVLTVAALAAYVAISALAADGPDADTATPETVPFLIAADKAVAATSLAQGASVVIVTLEPDKADDGNVLSYAPTRYEATLCYELAGGQASRDVAVTLERDATDKTPTAFAADLHGADTVYLLPAVEKEVNDTESDEEEKSNATSGDKPGVPSGCPPELR